MKDKPTKTTPAKPAKGKAGVSVNGKKNKTSKKPPTKTVDKFVIMELVCALIARGKSLVNITSSNLPGVPDYSTITRWLRADEETEDKRLCTMYTRAREDQADFIADEILAISDDSSLDEVFTDEGKRMLNSEFVQRSKLRIDARKWVASKLKPRKYGEKITQELTGENGSPIQVVSRIELVGLDGNSTD